MNESLTRGCAIVAVIAIMAGFQSIASADDIVPAPWRGDGLYTIQAWDFHTPGVIAPDDDNVTTINPNGEPTGGGSEGGWTSNFNDGNLDGYVGGNTNFLNFDIPNFIDFEPIKYIRVQINGIWGPTAPPFVNGIGAIDNEAVQMKPPPATTAGKTGTSFLTLTSSSSRSPSPPALSSTRW